MISAAGLTAIEARRRLVTFGPNALVPEASSGGIGHVLVQVLTDPMWILGATLGSLVIVEYVGPLASLLHLVPPSLSGWLAALAVAVITTCWTEPLKLLRRVSLVTRVTG